MKLEQMSLKSAVFTIFLLLLILFTPVMGIAGQYMWTDQNGEVHITDDFSKVPPQYRPKNAPAEEVPETSPPIAAPYSGSWIIENADTKGLDRDGRAIQLDEGGTGFCVYGDELIGRFLWYEKAPDTLDIDAVYLPSNGEQEQLYTLGLIKYDRNRGILYDAKSHSVLRRMKRTLPTRSRSLPGSTVTLTGYWTTKMNSLDAVYMSLEADGTGTEFTEGKLNSCLTWMFDPQRNVIIEAKNCKKQWADHSVSTIKLSGKYKSDLDYIALQNGNSVEYLYRIGKSIEELSGMKMAGMEKAIEPAESMRRAAAGDAYAASRLARANYGIKGSHLKKKELLKWLRKAAEAGSVEDQYILGKSYCFGYMSAINFEEGLRWIQKAAANGHLPATVFMEKYEAMKSSRRE